jgi:GNAT superfamily N-acetyltransferase
MMGDDDRVIRVERGRFEEAVAVLCEAFYDYPAMRFIIGAAGDGYSDRLRRLIGFFTEARFLRDDLVLATVSQDEMTAVATLARPGTSAPAALEEHRRRLWNELGEAARVRYEAFGAAIESFARPEPCYHLPMIGVRRRWAGRGQARLLLDAAHQKSEHDPGSRGVSLNTESRDNVGLYEHFGYRVVGHVQLGELETWGLYRPNAS